MQALQRAQQAQQELAEEEEEEEEEVVVAVGRAPCTALRAYLAAQRDWPVALAQ